MNRWVRKDRRIYSHSLCKLCGTAGFTNGICDRVTCLACGSAQCHANGSGHGSCSICLIGILPGWSGWNKRKCGYKDCNNQGVAFYNKVRTGCVCKEHLKRAKLYDYIQNLINKRNENWEQVEDGTVRISHWDKLASEL